MRCKLFSLALAVLTSLLPGLVSAERDGDGDRTSGRSASVQLGPRPFFLVNDMTDSPLIRLCVRSHKNPFGLRWLFRRS